MANGKTHRAVGAIAGGAYAYHRARYQPPAHALIETLGGVLAGVAGARLPDIFDPPLHPGHRSIAHGLVPVAAAGRAGVMALDRWQACLRADADRRAALRQAAVTPLDRLWHAIVELLCRLGAGALAGLLAGYGSHVALDAFTLASIPLFL
jgi:membrane-bound metal-dependent hydrolase YbcI (DUF457 family)